MVQCLQVPSAIVEVSLPYLPWQTAWQVTPNPGLRIRSRNRAHQPLLSAGGKLMDKAGGASAGKRGACQGGRNLTDVRFGSETDVRRSGQPGRLCTREPDKGRA